MFKVLTRLEPLYNTDQVGPPNGYLTPLLLYNLGILLSIKHGILYSFFRKVQTPEKMLLS